MDYSHSTTKSNHYTHLTLKERVIIELRRSERRSYREIARELGRSASTIRNEFLRGQKSDRIARRDVIYYDAEWSHQRYQKARQASRKAFRALGVTPFLKAVEALFFKEGWSLDAIRGRLLSEGLFSHDEVVCTKTLYHYIEDGLLRIKNIDLPEKVSRKKSIHREHVSKRILGTGIEERPKEVNDRLTFGHWEIDTIIGSKDKEDEVLLVLTERKTRMNLCRKLLSKRADLVQLALQEILGTFGDRSKEVFRTITSDNGLEFSGLSRSLEGIVPVYYCHPYSSHERGSIERQNRLMRRFIRKGQRIERFREEDILWFTDRINAMPRKIFQYRSSEDLFEEELDRIYALSA